MAHELREIGPLQRVAAGDDDDGPGLTKRGHGLEQGARLVVVELTRERA